ncbi:hypothetical protein [uncultured Roseobacter sp.]|uniref:hypothetical protein n=1 Tax=uncultured Roseobacter sp. TaxID=114847 RepID=UPI002628CDBF|nr:hypothetical protein [uncultured Roseobacter sp.]
MIETFALIQKSAESNRVDNDALRTMMRPLVEALSEAGVLHTGEGVPASRDPLLSKLTAGQRAAMHLAHHAALKDLTAALLGRLEAQDARLADHGEEQ